MRQVLTTMPITASSPLNSATCYQDETGKKILLQRHTHRRRSVLVFLKYIQIKQCEFPTSDK